MAWVHLPLDEPLNRNADAASLHRAIVRMENCYLNDAGGHTKFPGFVEFARVGEGPVYLAEWRGDMIAVSARGRVYRVSSKGAVEDVTGLAVQGPNRPTFARTDNELVIAAGGPMVRFAGRTTELLSQEAPETTHVAYLSGYLVAIEPGTTRWRYSKQGSFTEWPALNVLSAEELPDPLTAATVTPYSELMLAGPESVEQWEPIGDPDQPFGRRWTAADGVIAPYSLFANKEGTWGINPDNEFVSFSGQASQSTSAPIQRVLDQISDWRDAWTAELYTDGQKWLLFQAPHAPNDYGLTGRTFIYDIRKNAWAELFGWDAAAGLPRNWPGYSHLGIWGEHYIGGDGVIYRLDRAAHDLAGETMRVMSRTSHYRNQGHPVRVDNLRVQLKRGVGATNADREPMFSIRWRRDQGAWSPWVRKKLGLAGNRFPIFEYGQLGTADTWQFEWAVTDEAEVEVTKIEANMAQVN